MATVDVKFGGSSRELQAEAKKAERSVERFTTKAKVDLKSVALAGAGALGLTELSSGISELLSEFDKVGKFATRLDTAAESIQRLGVVAELNGASMDEIVNALTRFERKLASGGSTITSALDELQLSAQQLEAASPERKLELIADAFASAPNRGKAFAALFSLLEDDAKKLIPLLENGGDAIRRLANDVDVLAEADVRSIEAFNDEFTKLQNTTKISFLQSIAPELPQIIDGLKTGAQAFGDFTRFVVENQNVIKALVQTWLVWKGVNIASTLAQNTARQVSNTAEMVKQRGVLGAVTALLNSESNALRNNSAAQRENAAARTAQSSQPKLGAGGRTRFNQLRSQGVAAAPALSIARAFDAQAGKAGRSFSKRVVSAISSDFARSAGPLAVGLGGQLVTQLLPESKRLGGAMGSSLLDGLSGTLALFGPAGMVAALGIQSTKLFYAAGEAIADKFVDGISDELQKSAGKAVFSQDFIDAANVGDQNKALNELLKTRREFEALSKSSDGDAARVARNSIEIIDKQVQSLDKLIARLAEKRRVEAEAAAALAALPIERRISISDDLDIELGLLKAIIAGEEGRVAVLERAKALNAEIAAIKRSEKGISDDDAEALARKKLELAEKAKKVQDEAAEAEKQQAAAEKERAAAKDRAIALAQETAAAIRSQLPLEDQLTKKVRDRQKILDETGAGNERDLFKAGLNAGRSGDVEQAEELFKKLKQVQTLRGEIKDLEGQQRDVEDARLVFDLERQIAQARGVGNQDLASAKQRELDVLQQAFSIESSLNVQRGEALRLAQQMVAAREDEQRLQVGASRADFSTELKALELESSGRKREADALRDKAALLDRARELQGSLNVEAGKALELAQREADAKRQIEENEKNRRRGRRRGGIGDGLNNSNIRRSGGINFSNFSDSKFKESTSLFDSLAKRLKVNDSEKQELKKKDDVKSLAFLSRLSDSNEELVNIMKGLGTV